MSRRAASREETVHSGDRAHSELECFVLGVVSQLGPCSAYEVRVHMARSPSTQWSGSAGAIYPLVGRLEREGLLLVKETWRGRRASRRYRLSASGRRVLRRWIGPPLSPAAVTVSYDPLRSRARFLALLSATERAAWIAAARRALDEAEAKVRDWEGSLPLRDELFAASLTSSGELDVRARREWLGVLEKAVRAAGRRRAR